MVEQRKVGRLRRPCQSGEKFVSILKSEGTKKKRTNERLYSDFFFARNSRRLLYRKRRRKLLRDRCITSDVPPEKERYYLLSSRTYIVPIVIGFPFKTFFFAKKVFSNFIRNRPLYDGWLSHTRTHTHTTRERLKLVR